MLAGAVKLLHKNRGRLAGTVKFMFQPGEEGHFGALRMIEDGLIDKHPRPDGAFAMHITPNVPTGIFTAKAGPFMASTDERSRSASSAKAGTHRRRSTPSIRCRSRVRS